jgi:hypothetical protein
MGGAYLIGVAFWLFVGACAVTAIITEYKKRRMGVELALLLTLFGLLRSMTYNKMASA